MSSLNACNRCGKRFRHPASVQNHQSQQTSNCWKSYMLLVDRKQTSSSSKAEQRSDSPTSSFTTQQTPPFLPMPSPPISVNAMEMDDIDNLVSEPAATSSQFYAEYFPGASEVFGKGETYMDLFDEDKYAEQRQTIPYYPFASQIEWEMASYLLKSGLSMAAMDEFLKLQLVEKMELSFKSAKDLRNRAEILPTFKPKPRMPHNGQSLDWIADPQQGLRWISKSIIPESPTKHDVTLYYRDPILCLQYLMQSPLVQDHISFTPFKLYQSAAKLMRIYTEWLSGNQAWNIQTQLGAGATVLGVILSSDKTNISAMTGGRSAHPLLISLANISQEFRNKASNHLYLLLALLPIPKFIHRKKRIRGMLEARLYHFCLDTVLAPLKTAATIGVMLSDPVGNLRWCFTPLASFIVDTPEAQLIACVGGKTSPVTMANYQQFGDDFRHPPRTGTITLGTINKIHSSETDLGTLEKYEKVAKSYRLNGVQLPFWRDWPLSADPSAFLTSEPLHHWHKQFWDHDAKWCVNAVGDSEIDFRFSVLHNRTGYRHFAEGISKLKQVTGREQRDIQRYIIVVIADTVPPQFLIAIRALLDFRYLAQSPRIDENVCQRITDALLLFHQHKQAILDAGARRGKKNKLDHFEIPKLELLQSVVPTIKLNGPPCQWSADFTEHAHIEVVKEPGRSGNNHAYESQICRYLDRLEKIRHFTLVTAIRNAGIRFGGATPAAEGSADDDGDEMDFRDDAAALTTAQLLPFLWTSGYHTGTPKVVDYFYRADLMKKGLLEISSLQPLRTYQCAKNVVYHLSRDPSLKITITEATNLFNINDLSAAIGGYIMHLSSDPILNSHLNSLGGRRRIYPGQLPVSRLQIWKKLRIQTTSYHHPYDKLVPYTINAVPPSATWPHGRYDTALFNTDSNKEWPRSGLLGHIIVDVCLIFRILPSTPYTDDTPLGRQITSRFLAYVRRYDIVPQQDPMGNQYGMYPDRNTGLYLLKRAVRSTGEVLGDIIPLDQLRSLVDLAPRFGAEADPRLTNTNSIAFGREFWLNKYFDKELFYILQ